jgi:transcription elongation factor/antiterminator RfaH
MSNPFLLKGVMASALLPNENERWYLVHTLPRCELRAQFNLAQQGFRTFVPQILRTTRHARQLRTTRGAFFPRYLFVVLDLARDRWLSVRGTIGVSSLFTCGDKPVAVPAGIVEELIERFDDTSLPRFDMWRRGQKVRILSGSFSNFVGTLERLDEKRRVQVLLEMMGAAVPISIDRSRLLPVKVAAH